MTINEKQTQKAIFKDLFSKIPNNFAGRLKSSSPRATEATFTPGLINLTSLKPRF